jgi:hypothetical protein
MMRNYAQLWLSSIAIAALIASAGAQTWDETANGGGDAGDLPATAQVVSGSGPFDRDNRRNQQQHGCGYVPDIDL